MTAIFAARSLARAGFHVIVGLGTEYSTARYSRFCDEVFRHPPIEDVETFMTALQAFITRRPDVTLILPLLPKYVECLAVNHDRLPEGPVIAMADPDLVLACIDKDRLLVIAAEASVPIRRSAVVRDLAELQASAATIGFPCVVKPASDAAGWMPGRRKAIRARDAQELRRELPAWPSGHPALIVQPWVEGPRYNLNFAARDGRVLRSFHSLAVRTDRLDGSGTGVEWVFPPPDGRLLRATEALLTRLRYTGVGTMQFLIPDHGEPHFLELNPRVGMPAHLSTAFGFDVIEAACQLAGVDVGWHEDLPFTSPVGRRGAWTSRDAYGLLMALGSGEASRHDILSWSASLVRSALRADVHLTWAKDDPMPTIVAWATVLWPGTWLALRRTGRLSKGSG